MESMSINKKLKDPQKSTSPSKYKSPKKRAAKKDLAARRKRVREEEERLIRAGQTTKRRSKGKRSSREQPYNRTFSDTANLVDTSFSESLGESRLAKRLEIRERKQNRFIDTVLHVSVAGLIVVLIWSFYYLRDIDDAGFEDSSARLIQVVDK